MNYNLCDLGFYPMLPLDNWVTSGKFLSTHLGMDGYGANYHISATDGVVTMAQNWGTAGYTIRVRYDDPKKRFSIFTHYKHGKANTFLVKVGDKVKKGQKLQTIGTTGDSTGIHIHFDFVITPYKYDYQQSSADRKKYSKNPLNYVCIFENQKANDSFSNVVGTSKKVSRDTSKNQIEVLGNLLRCRKGAGTNQTVLGYVDYGIYNYTETKTANGYTWYKLSFGWIAGTKEDTKVYQKEEINEEIIVNDSTVVDDIKAMEELKKENKELIKKLEDYSNLKEFVAEKEGYWKIYLRKDEKIYY